MAIYQRRGGVGEIIVPQTVRKGADRPDHKPAQVVLNMELCCVVKGEGVYVEIGFKRGPDLRKPRAERNPNNTCLSALRGERDCTTYGHGMSMDSAHMERSLGNGYNGNKLQHTQRLDLRGKVPVEQLWHGQTRKMGALHVHVLEHLEGEMQVDLRKQDVEHDVAGEGNLYSTSRTETERATYQTDQHGVANSVEETRRGHHQAELRWSVVPDDGARRDRGHRERQFGSDQRGLTMNSKRWISGRSRSDGDPQRNTTGDGE